MIRAFELMYRLGFTPWERTQPPPELVGLVEGDGALPVGRALDLGCGMGGSAIYLASLGWDVSAVDAVERAIHTANKRAQSAGQRVRFVHGDVAAIASLGLGDGYSLVLDIGCLHTIPREQRPAYAAGVMQATVPGAAFLSMGFQPAAFGVRPPGFDSAELLALLPGWTLNWEHPDPGISGIGPMQPAHPTWRLLTRDDPAT